ncbi:MAG: hypothetical protein ACLUQ6_12590 [Alistipes onderdonkii]
MSAMWFYPTDAATVSRCYVTESEENDATNAAIAASASRAAYEYFSSK